MFFPNQYSNTPLLHHSAGKRRLPAGLVLPLLLTSLAVLVLRRVLLHLLLLQLLLVLSIRYPGASVAAHLIGLRGGITPFSSLAIYILSTRLVVRHIHSTRSMSVSAGSG